MNQQGRSLAGLVFAVALAASCARAAETVLAGDFSSAEQGWGHAQDWKIAGAQATLEAGRWGGIHLAAAVQPASYYRLSFSCASPALKEGSPPQGVTVNGGDVPGAPMLVIFRLGSAWTRGEYYFYSGALDKIVLQWAPEGVNAGGLALKEVLLEKLSEEDFSRNLAPDPDLNQGQSWPAAWDKVGAWKTSAGESAGEFSIVPEAGYLEAGGAGRLRTTGEEAVTVSVSSSRIPLVPGRKYRVSGWFKNPSSEPVPATLTLDGWSSPLVGKHWFHGETFRVGQEWEEHSFTIAVPTEADYPCLRFHTGRLQIGVQGKDMELLVTNVSCARLE